MSYQVSQSENAKWVEIRNATFHVVLLTCRSDGLWSIPTIPSEIRETYSVPGAPDDKQRQSAKFGSSSITVSYNALAALTAVMGTIPRPIANRVIAQIENQRKKNGGYGTWVERMNQWEVNAVARHTAMAVMSHLEFGSGDAPSSLRKHLEPSINWLLDDQLTPGGWPYDRTDPPYALGFLSTASSICALQSYLDRFGDYNRQLSSRASKAITKGLSALAGEQRSGVWSNDGSPLDRQVRDSAFALRLALKVNHKGQLDALPTVPPNAVGTMIAEFSACAVENGWPKRAGEAAPNVAGSISALALTIEAGNPAGLSLKKMRQIKNGITKSWDEKDAPQHLAAWDWQCLAILASKISGPLTASQATEIENSCQRLRAMWSSGKLRQRDVTKLDDTIRKTIVYSLTEGLGFRSISAKMQIFGALSWTTKKVSENLLVQGVIAFLWLIVAGLGSGLIN